MAKSPVQSMRHPKGVNKYVLDRFEGDKAVLEYGGKGNVVGGKLYEGGGTFSVPRSMLPAGAKEGTHLKLGNPKATSPGGRAKSGGRAGKESTPAYFVIVPSATKKAATRVKGKLDKLKKK